MAKPAATAENSFARLAGLVAHLRAPDGCPWDRAQTHESLQDALIEEAWETVAAIRQGDPEALAEELGDLLLHVLMQAQIASEGGDFDIQRVLDGVSEKLVRRHPHVFGDAQADTPQAVVETWEGVKRGERAGRQRPDEWVHLPALLAAAKLQQRLAQGPETVGADALEGWLTEADSPQDGVGKLLYAAVALARSNGVDAEVALQRRLQKGG